MPLEERVLFGEAAQKITEDEDIQEAPWESLKKIDLACGTKVKEGFIGVDSVLLDGVEIVHDLLTFPWPFEDGEVYEFNCEHFVEHIPIQLLDGSYGLHKFMEEVYRCLMGRGTIRIVAPYYMSVGAWQDPCHARAITPVTFEYYNKQSTVPLGLDHYQPNVDFECVSRTSVLFPEWDNRSDEHRMWAMKHYWNVVNEIHFVLRKR